MAAEQKKKVSKKPIIVRQKNGRGFKYIDVSTELDELSKQDCVDLITVVARTQMAKDIILVD